MNVGSTINLHKCKACGEGYIFLDVNDGKYKCDKCGEVHIKRQVPKWFGNGRHG
jgi:predicted RNA-binding Zn-ribbon protein involved in translation (DUF1610 family)